MVEPEADILSIAQPDTVTVPEIVEPGAGPSIATLGVWANRGTATTVSRISLFHILFEPNSIVLDTNHLYPLSVEPCLRLLVLTIDSRVSGLARYWPCPCT